MNSYKTVIVEVQVKPNSLLTGLEYKIVLNKYKNMYRVESRDYKNEIWATGFFDKQKAQDKIDSGYYHKNMFNCDKHKKLVVVEYQDKMFYTQ